MRIPLLSLMWLCYSFSPNSLALAKDDRPSVEEVIARAPVLNSSEVKFKSLEVRGEVAMSGGTRLKFRAIYRAPDRHAVLLSDGADDTPIFFFADSKLFIYDPMKPCIIVLSNMKSDFSIAQIGEDFRFYFNFSGRENPQFRDESRLFVDVKSLFTVGNKRLELGENAEGHRELTRFYEGGDTLKAAIDLSQEQPFSGLERFTGDVVKPVCSIDKLVIDGDIEDGHFEFPKLDHLPRGIAVRDGTAGGLLKMAGDVALGLRTLAVRMGLNQPEDRDSIKIAGVSVIDWDQVKANDRKFSAAMKELIPSGFRPSCR